MGQLSGYVLSITAAAIVVAILTATLDKKSGTGTLVKMMGSLFLAFTVIQPIVHMDFSGLTDFWESFSADGEAWAADGENMARDAICAIIKSDTEAYILDKAKTYRAELTVEVTLSQDQTPVPVAARLQGSVSPYAKAQLQQMMEDDLGILRVNQIWIG